MHCNGWVQTLNCLVIACNNYEINAVLQSGHSTYDTSGQQIQFQSVKVPATSFPGLYTVLLGLKSRTDLIVDVFNRTCT